jgi:hypothetical protein
VFRGSEQLAAGRLTRGQLRSSAWQRLFPDVYVCTSVEVDHALRARAVAGLLLPTGVISGRSAAVLWGVPLADADDAVECTVGPDVRAGAVRGIALNRRSLRPDEVVRRGGVRVTTPIRTALDLARISPEPDAVVCLDRLVRAGLVPLAVLGRAADALTGAGCRQVRRAVSLTDGLAESPQETRVRLLLHASSLPRPVAQHTVRRADGAFVARVDFAWPDRKLALEYEGAWHGAVQQVGRDRRRLNALTAAGWTVLFVTAADLHDPVALIARIAAALAVPGYASGRSLRGR